MKQRHLSDVAALDVALGDAQDGDAIAHVAQCAECGARVAAVREGRRLAAEATLIEPGEIFWSSLRARVTARVAEQARAPRLGGLRFRIAWSLATAAVVVLAAVWSVQGPQAPPPPAAQAVWVPLEAPDEDGSLALISEIAPAAEDDSQSAAECGGCLEGLTDQERQVVIETLRQEIGRRS